MSSMLEQAIVDAKALKEAAYKSAEDALVERYSPELKEAVYSMLEQEDDVGEIDALMGGGVAPPDQGEGEVSGMDIPLAATDGEDLCACPDDDEEVEIDFDDLERQMAADEGDEEMGAMAGLADQEPIDITIDDDEEVALSENDLFSMLGEEGYDDEDGYDDFEVTGAEWDNNPDPFDPYGIGYEEPEDNSSMPVPGSWMDGEEDLYDDDLYDDEMYEAIREAVVDVTKGKKYWDMKKEKERKSYPKKRPQKDSKPEPRAGLQESKQKTSDQKVLSENKALVRENKALNEELKKAISHSKSLESQFEKLEERYVENREKLVEVAEVLNEVNLQNAKLLYKNEVLKSVSLNERQKDKIVEAISNAGTVSEAKVVYETLINSVGTDNKSRKPKSLNETVSRKQTLMVSRRRPEEATNPLKDRWQKMAGIV